MSTTTTAACSVVTNRRLILTEKECSTVKKPRDTYRFVIRLGPAFVQGGITDDLDRAEDEARLRWPLGRFHQVGEITTADDAQEWLTRNGFAAQPG